MTIVVAVLKVEASVRGKLANVNASIPIFKNLQCSQLSNKIRIYPFESKCFVKGVASSLTLRG